MDIKNLEVPPNKNIFVDEFCHGFYRSTPDCFYMTSDAPKAKIPKLKILSVDPCITENGRTHMTSKYEIMNQKGSNAQLVVRRGQEFSLKLNFNRDYNVETDEISISFTLDQKKGTKVSNDEISVVTPLINFGEVSKKAWRASSDSTSRKSIKIKIKSPSDAIIGKWKLKVESKTKSSSTVAKNSVIDMMFYMIFNPWCSDDTAFMEDEMHRQEYLISDEGLIWMGTKNSMVSKYWKYSQFQKDILDCAFYLLTEVAKVQLTDRNNPVLIARGLSAVINSNENGGVLMESCSKDPNGGTTPLKWMGSLEILKKYYEKKIPVKYGECWVFSGVLTTILRCLGLPCRVVTNFGSAHGSGGNLDVDYVFDPASAKRRTDLSNNSLWNFHVWNEVWMERLDLGPKYGGWQVLDATPQSKNGEISAYGPSSVVAIKHGEVDLPFNGNFIYAEINANEYQWIYHGNGKRELISKDRCRVGRLISTKAVGCREREDLTHTYKFSRDSIEERESMLNAHQHCKTSFDRYFVTKKFNDVRFNIELRHDVVIGSPFSVVLTMKNQNSIIAHTIVAVMRVETVHYTGRERETVKISKTRAMVKPGEVERIKSNFSWEEYGPKLLSHGAFKITCSAIVDGVDFEFVMQEDFSLLKPNIQIELATNAEVNKAVKATATFVNPLPVTLKSGKFQIMRPGSDLPMTIRLSKNVKAGDEASCTFSITPQLEGSAAIAVKFHSQELDDVEGFLPMMVNGRV